MRTKDTVLITGASTGIGAVYAERFARRGHNLVLVARDFQRLDVLANRLWAQTGVNVAIEVADRTQRAEEDCACRWFCRARRGRKSGRARAKM